MTELNTESLIFFVVFGLLSIPYTGYLTYMAWKFPDKLTNLVKDITNVDEKSASYRVSIMALFGPFATFFFFFVSIIGIFNSL